MNYEELYEELKGKEKLVKDGLSSLQKYMKLISRENEGGDVKGLCGIWTGWRMPRIR